MSRAASAVSDVAAGLGALVWWTLADTAITPDRMRAILAAEGADPTVVPDIDAASAIRRAAREWGQGRGHADRYRAEVVREDSATVLVGILRRESVVVGAEVRWRQVDAVTYDVASAAWSSVGTSPEAVSFIGAADETRRHLDHQWIRPHVVQAGLALAGACSLRDRGGVYYVPTQRTPELDRLVRIVSQIGGSHLDVVHVAATGSSQSAIARSASASVREDLSGLTDRIRGWSESARRVSDASSASVLTELAELKSRADLYADALHVGLDDLAEAIDAARAEAVRILGVAPAVVERAPRAEGAPVVPRPTGAPTTAGVARMRALIEVATPRADGVLVCDAAALAAAQCPASWATWTGKGARYDAAIACGYVPRATRGGDAMLLIPVTPAQVAIAESEPTPVEPEPESAPTPVEPEPVTTTPVPEPTEPEPETRVVPDADAEDVADVRERLADANVTRLRALWADITRADAPSGWRKPRLVDELCAPQYAGALADRGV